MKGDILPAVHALNDLVETARWRENVARFKGLETITTQYAEVANQLDACRTQAALDGDDYAPEAWAFVDAGRGAIARIAMLEQGQQP